MASTCPPGFTGKAVQGVGLEFARSNKQVCRDVNECDSSHAAACVSNSQCINTAGSFTCGDCIHGFVGNQSVGCHPHPGTCPDGTVCDGNAECFMRRGSPSYLCRVCEGSGTRDCDCTLSPASSSDSFFLPALVTRETRSAR